MTNRLLAVIIIFPIWIALVLVFRKHRQWLLYYLIAAFGLTVQLVLLAEYFGLDQILVNIASFHVHLVSKYLFGIPAELLSNGRFQLTLVSGETNILKLGIECSAVLESSVLFSLVLFYPIYNWRQKILRITFGLILTYIINIARLMIIVLMAYKFGSDYIFFAHAGVARIFFFVSELFLYWYLMTKPTLRKVGERIAQSKKITVNQLSHQLRLRHSIIQSIVVFIFVSLTLLSFLVTDEWRQSFTGQIKQTHPIIYQDETSLTPASKTVSSFYQELALDLLANQKQLFTFNIEKEEELNLQVVDGQKDMAIRLIINGESIELVSWDNDKSSKVDPVFKPFKVKPGDILEVKFQNLTASASQYLVRIFPNGTINNQICGLDSPEGLISKSISPTPTPIPSPTPTPETQNQQANDISLKSILGQSSGSQLNKVIALDLLAGKEVQYQFEIKKEEKLNIQVLEGQEDLACKVLINGRELGTINMASWRYKQYSSIFEPFKVNPEDKVEIIFINPSDTDAIYQVKVYPSEGENVE